MTAYRWVDGDLEAVDETVDIRPGCIMLVAESPHIHEFKGQRPVAPLRNPATRARLRKHLPRLIAAASAALRLRLQRADVALANPVQFQASLHHLMSNPAIPLQACVRDAVWKEMFAREEVRCDFRNRIRAAAPAMIIVATTSGVRSALLRFVNDLAIPYAVVNRHPSSWNRGTRVLRP
jgi:hypothetical protein